MLFALPQADFLWFSSLGVQRYDLLQNFRGQGNDFHIPLVT